MSHWARITVPPICERMIGFSIPTKGEILVVSFEGTHLIGLGDEIEVRHDNAFREYDIYDPDTGIARYEGRDYPIIGLWPGDPVLRSPQGESLRLDTEKEELEVIRAGETLYSLQYENFSGDWAAATFSRDGNWLVLGCPYDFVLLRRSENAI